MITAISPKVQTKLCAIYTRKSTDENLNTEFSSIDSQREYCQAFVKSREGEGWKVSPEVYSDPAFTGGNMNRPGLQKLLADAKAGKFQVVVCYKYDRLSRNTRDFLHVLDVFDKAGIAFASVTQPIDTGSSVGRLMRSILMDFAQFEREIISERTRDKVAAMARKGLRSGGRPILGYDYDKKEKRYLVNPKEAKVVKFMFKTYLKFRSLLQTAKLLNEEGYRMKRWINAEGHDVGGARFNRTSVHNLLTNPFYTGKIEFHNDIFAGQHEAIIEPVLFEDVKKALADNYARHKSPHQDKHQFLLKGLVRCAACQSAMSPSFGYSHNKQAYLYYRCISTNKMDKSACKVRSVAARNLDKFVLDRLAEISQDQALVNDIVAKASATPLAKLGDRRQERTTLNQQLSRVQTSVDNILDHIATVPAGTPESKALLGQLDEWGTKKEALTTKLAVMESEIRALEEAKIDADLFRNNIRAFVEVFENLDFYEKKELIRLLVREVVFDGINSEIYLDLIPFQAAGKSPDHFDFSFKNGEPAGAV